MPVDGILDATTALYLIPVMTLLLGILIGFMAQRSGFCSIGGFRDLILFKQTRLFFGFLSLIGGGFIGYFIFSVFFPEAFPNFFWVLEKGIIPIPGSPPGTSLTGTIAFAIIGGIGMGVLGVLLGGCPLRQMVMGSEGNVKSLYFVLGMMIGAFIFHLWIRDTIFVPIMNLIFPVPSV